MKIEQHISDILAQGKFQDFSYFLPDIRLDRKDYVKCNDVLQSLWLVWNKGKKAHIGDVENPEETFKEILESGEVETLKEYRDKYQFFPTPSELAELLVEYADIKESDIVLEPSAWQWAILDKIPNCKEIHFIELDPKNFQILKDKGYYRALWFNGDFLQAPKYPYTKIVMNPPFANSQDVKHILHAYSLLSEDGWRLVSIASSSIKTRQGKPYDELRALNPEYIEVESNSFKESWTNVNTVIVILNKWK